MTLRQLTIIQSVFCTVVTTPALVACTLKTSRSSVSTFAMVAIRFHDCAVVDICFAVGTLPSIMAFAGVAIANVSTISVFTRAFQTIVHKVNGTRFIPPVSRKTFAFEE